MANRRAVALFLSVAVVAALVPVAPVTPAAATTGATTASKDYIVILKDTVSVAARCAKKSHWATT